MYTPTLPCGVSQAIVILSHEHLTAMAQAVYNRRCQTCSRVFESQNDLQTHVTKSQVCGGPSLAGFMTDYSQSRIQKLLSGLQKAVIHEYNIDDEDEGRLKSEDYYEEGVLSCPDSGCDQSKTYSSRFNLVRHYMRRMIDSPRNFIFDSLQMPCRCQYRCDMCALPKTLYYSLGTLSTS